MLAFDYCSICNQLSSVRNGICIRCKWKTEQENEVWQEVRREDRVRLEVKPKKEPKPKREPKPKKEPKLKREPKSKLVKVKPQTIQERILELLSSNGRPYTSIEICNILELNPKTLEYETYRLHKARQIHREYYTGNYQGRFVKTLPSFWVKKFKIVPEPFVKMMDILKEGGKTTKELCDLIGINDTTVKVYYRKFPQYIGRNQRKDRFFTYYKRHGKELPEPSQNGLTYEY
jgi:DNA-binding CsgD family transcriptional regulator